LNWTYGNWSTGFCQAA